MRLLLEGETASALAWARHAELAAMARATDDADDHEAAAEAWLAAAEQSAGEDVAL